MRFDEDGIDVLGIVDSDVRDRELATAKVFVTPALGGESFGLVLVEAFGDDAAAAHVNSGHFKAAMAWMPDVVAETPEIINVQVPGDTWSRMAEVTPSGA